jgi:hypothetical protein
VQADSDVERYIRKALEVWDDPAFVTWAKRWLDGEDRSYRSAAAMLAEMRYGRYNPLSEIFGLSVARAAVELAMERTAQSADGEDTAASVDAWLRGRREGD